MPKQSKQSLSEYESLMKQKFDTEDRMDTIANERWRLNNENLKCSQQLRLIEDQIRLMFNRMRVELKKEVK